MLVWALRYLVVAVVVGAGFAMLQSSDWLTRLGPAHSSKASIASKPRPAKSGRAAAPDSEDWEYVVTAGSNGHFVVDAMVNGSPITFLVDTGASDIVLTLADARRLGFLPGNLDFSEQYQTANGEVRGAPVRLRELRIGQYSLYDLDASVNEGPMEVSLLGMSFLQQLRGYQVEDGRLILRW
jgi:aspartyl protease family protein